MTFRRALAIRLAGAKVIAPALAAFLLASCAPGEAKDFVGNGPPGSTLSAVIVTPHSGSVIAKEMIQFAAYGRGSAGDSMAVQVNWSASGGDISPTGLFTATTAGEFHVLARAQGAADKVDSAIVTVRAGLTVSQLVVTPNQISLTGGAQQQFSSLALLSDGNSQQVPVTWTANGGTVDQSGSFTAGSTSGSFYVRAQAQNGVADSALVTISSSAPFITTLILNPSATILAPTKTQQFSVTAAWNDGGVTSPPVSYSATGGTITQSGLYTAGSKPGKYRVITKKLGNPGAGRADSSDVTITVPPLSGVSVTPKTANLYPGASQNYAAQGLVQGGGTRAVGVNWSSNGGTVSLNGTFTAGVALGTFKVIATVAGSTMADTAAVTISQPSGATLTNFILNPGTATAGVGGTIQFSTAASWSNGGSALPPVTYGATGGTISTGGLYTAGSTPGTYRVIAVATGFGKADTSTVTVTGSVLTALAINPGSVSLPLGGTQQFGATASYSDGSSRATTASYSATGGTITTSGLYTAGNTPGIYQVVASVGDPSVADTSVVSISQAPPTLTGITIAPKATNLTSGSSAQFSVNGTWTNGGQGAPTVTYSTAGGTITGGGFFTAGTTPGTFPIIAQVFGGTLADTATVTITNTPPVLQAVVLTPATASLASGATLAFQVTGVWTNGGGGAPAVTFKANGGTITSAGVFTAGTTSGTYRVIATQQGGTLADTSMVTIASGPPSLNSLSMTPATATVPSGASVQFSVSGTLTNGTTITPAVTYTAMGGVVTASGSYTAGTVTGTFKVIATQSGGTLADTSTVTVTPPVLTQLMVTPTAAAVPAGLKQQFSATGVLSNGNSVIPQVAYSATGGTINSSGLFTASSTQGTYRVITRPQTASTLVDTSFVSVTAPVLTQVILGPKGASVSAGAKKQYTVSGVWSDGANRAPIVYYSATGGTISATGLFSAGQVAGTFSVIAACACGPADTGSVIVTPTAPPVLSGIVVSPKSTTVQTGGTTSFTATGIWTNGGSGTPTITWTSTGGGVINSSGAYTAGTTTGTFHVVATGGGYSDTATVVVNGQTSSNSVPAELPRVFLNTAYQAPTGQTTNLPAGGNLQAALNNANCGDLILLAPNAVFTGNFTLPVKTCTGRVTVMTNTSLPPEGTRMTPALAGGLAKILSPNSLGAVTTAWGAKGYRFVGVEFGVDPSQTNNYGIVRLGVGNENSVAAFPSDLVLDRVYIHGNANLNVSRCVALNGAASAVIDSYLSECHASGFDSQAIGGWGGPGPYKIVNNYLEAAGENVLFGGSDPLVVGVLPSDIEIRRNWVYKPMAWKVAGGWTIKNLLELKNAQRVLLEANIFENNWVAAQPGNAILFKSVDQNGKAPWSTCSDITFRYNIVKNSANAMAIAALPQPPGIPAARISISHSLFIGIGAAAVGGIGQAIQLDDNLSDISIEHTTLIFDQSPGATRVAALLPEGVAQEQRLTIQNNLWEGGQLGVKRSNFAGGTASLSAAASSWTFAGNVLTIPQAQAGGYPAGNSYPTSLSAISFVDLVGGDFRLTPTSPYHHSATDGTDPGADITTLLTLTAGVDH